MSSTDRRSRLGMCLAGILIAALSVPVSAQDEEGNGPAQPGGVLPGEPAIELVQVASGLVDPVDVADDGSDRIFVVERIGRIRVVAEDGRLLETPFLDIGNVVKTDFLEQGLLGLAFAPDYADSGFFYVYYSDYSTNGNSRVVRYQVSDEDANIANPDSATLILDMGHDPYTNHNGGTIRFGPDGYLYIAVGDGGRAGDPFDNAQDVRSWFGKVHRIDVDPEDGSRYAIPEDNPFAQAAQVQLRPGVPADYHPGARPEIWAYGLRNPWQIHFDVETGDLYIPDVGQVAWEEVDFQPAGAEGGRNYGWDWLEGSHCYPETLTDCPRRQVGRLPVAEYSHEDGDCSISGLGVHRADRSASLEGIYFNSDFCSGRVWGLTRDGDDGWVYQELLDTALPVTGGGTSRAGDVYLTSCSCAFGRDYDPFADPQGALWRIVAADEVPEGATTARLEGDADTGGAGGERAETSPEPEATPVGSTEPEATPEPEPTATAEPTPSLSAQPEPTAEPEPTDEPGPTPSDGDADAITRSITATDNAFDTDRLSVRAGVRVQLTLRNDGLMPHNFAIYTDDSASDAVFVGDLIDGGQEATYEFDAPAPGEYFFRCDVHPTEMTGTFVVQGG